MSELWPKVIFINQKSWSKAKGFIFRPPEYFDLWGARSFSTSFRSGLSAYIQITSLHNSLKRITAVLQLKCGGEFNFISRFRYFHHRSMKMVLRFRQINEMIRALVLPSLLSSTSFNCPKWSRFVPDTVFNPWPSKMGDTKYCMASNLRK